MKTKAWQQHLVEHLANSFDPTIYAVQWAQDARCMQRGAGHRRVGAFVQLNGRICRFWSNSGIRGWK